MTSRQRVSDTANHREPDRAPLDISATGRAGLRVEAHDALLAHLDVDDATSHLANPRLRLAEPSEGLLERYPADTEGFRVLDGTLTDDPETEERCEWQIRRSTEEGVSVEWANDLWGVSWTRRGASLEFQLGVSPLAGEGGVSLWERHSIPDPMDIRRWTPLRPSSYGTVLGGFGGGLWETALALRGRTDVLRDLATQNGLTARILDQAAEIKERYWEARLNAPDVRENPPTFLMETESLELLPGLPMSVREFRRLLKARWLRIFGQMRVLAPESRLLFFCDGYSSEALIELVEMGVSAVNLLPRSILEAKPDFLKREFGRDLTFWGGGVWERDEFLRGTAEQTSDQVKETLDLFAPGGGFVWSFFPVADATLPPGNVKAALDTLLEYGVY